jgi:hypothetical protein
MGSSVASNVDPASATSSTRIAGCVKHGDGFPDNTRCP